MERERTKCQRRYFLLLLYSPSDTWSFMSQLLSWLYHLLRFEFSNLIPLVFCFGCLIHALAFLLFPLFLSVCLSHPLLQAPNFTGMSWGQHPPTEWLAKTWTQPHRIWLWFGLHNSKTTNPIQGESSSLISTLKIKQPNECHLDQIMGTQLTCSLPSGLD